MWRGQFRFTFLFFGIMLRSVFAAISLCLSFTAFAQQENGNVDTLLVRDPTEAIFSKYKPNSNYFLLYDKPVKFEISVKSKLLTVVHAIDAGEETQERWQIYFGYTQKSLWDLYEESSPFRDSNYEPEIFAKYNIFTSLERIQLGVVHESNGKGEIDSRSWNRIYIEPKWNIGDYSDLYMKLWFPLFGLESNPDIIDYAGYGELVLISRYHADIQGVFRYISDGSIELKMRKGASPQLKKGSVQIGLTFGPFASYNQPALKGLSILAALYVQYFVGYGETLLDYSRYSPKLRVGITLGFE